MTEDPLLAELETELLKSTIGTRSHNRRNQNVEWVRSLALEGLKNKEVEIRIPAHRTERGEELAIQYPGKESKRTKTANPWDFRPKLIGREDSDLAFEEIWKPLLDDLPSVANPQIQRRAAGVVATLLYRMAYMVDYSERPAGNYSVTRIRFGERGRQTQQTMHMGSVWFYSPPKHSIDYVSSVIKDWAGMSFEAFLHYNSLLAWNEDLKIRARHVKWSATNPSGRINTLRTYIRVIGFTMGLVKPSEIFGGFMRKRGMSPASDEEILRICQPYVTRAEL